METGSKYLAKYLKYKTKYQSLKHIHLQQGGDKHTKYIGLNILKLSFVGKSYYSFFKKTLKPYNYIKNQDGFNLSFCSIDKNKQLYCVRFLGHVAAYFNEDIIPGNYSNISRQFIEKKLDRQIKFGKNFFWNCWTDTLLDNTVFFVGSYKNGKIFIDKKIKPYIISNEKAFTNINEGLLKYNDIRVVNINNEIYCYDGLITSIYGIKIIDNAIHIPINMDNDVYKKYFFYFKKKICSKCDNVNSSDDISNSDSLSTSTSMNDEKCFYKIIQYIHLYLELNF